MHISTFLRAQNLVLRHSFMHLAPGSVIQSMCRVTVVVKLTFPLTSERNVTLRVGSQFSVHLYLYVRIITVLFATVCVLQRC